MTQTLIQYGLLAACLGATLFLFWTVKREIRANAAKHRSRIEELATKVNVAPREPEPVYIAAAPRSGLNISKRVQAMRMVRRNEDVGHIAAALGVTRKEVELLIRVQQMSKA